MLRFRWSSSSNINLPNLDEIDSSPYQSKDTTNNDDDNAGRQVETAIAVFMVCSGLNEFVDFHLNYIQSMD